MGPVSAGDGHSVNGPAADPVTFITSRNDQRCRGIVGWTESSVDLLTADIDHTAASVQIADVCVSVDGKILLLAFVTLTSGFYSSASVSTEQAAGSDEPHWTTHPWTE